MYKQKANSNSHSKQNTGQGEMISYILHGRNLTVITITVVVNIML